MYFAVGIQIRARPARFDANVTAATSARKLLGLGYAMRKWTETIAQTAPVRRGALKDNWLIPSRCLGLLWFELIAQLEPSGGLIRSQLWTDRSPPCLYLFWKRLAESAIPPRARNHRGSIALILFCAAFFFPFACWPSHNPDWRIV